MLGGILVDIVVVAVVVGFIWAGYTLGAVRSVTRFVGSLLAFGIGVIAMRPLAALIEAITPLGPDSSRLIALLGAGIAAYFGLIALARYGSEWIPHERLYSYDQPLGGLFGGLLGALWVALMVSLLALSPSDSALSRWPIQSSTGQALIGNAGGSLRWLDDTFPRFTQTLPKGRTGVRTSAIKGQLLVIEEEPRSDDDAAGELFANINQQRNRDGKQDLVYNVDVARAASRHSTLMLENASFSYTAGTGTELEERVQQALAGAPERFDVVGQRVAWSHSVANAFAGLMDDEDARRMLLDATYVEIGIGVADGGWFNGTMFSIGLVGTTDEGPDDSPDEDAADEVPADDGAPVESDDLDDPALEEPPPDDNPEPGIDDPSGGPFN